MQLAGKRSLNGLKKNGHLTWIVKQLFWKVGMVKYPWIVQCTDCSKKLRSAGWHWCGGVETLAIQRQNLMRKKQN